MYRQGDILLIPIEKMPAGACPVARQGGCLVLAHGKATGPAHVIKDERAALFCDPKFAAIFMLVEGEDPVALEHEEHDTIAIPPGEYRIVRQREYSPDAFRTMAD
jgi:hypothetical protein